ncbi:MAG: glycosyltransferase [Flavobacteriales bacterium]
MRLLLLGAASSIHLQRWANAFAQRGHETHLITLHAPLGGYDERVRIHRLPYRGGAGYLTARGAAARLAQRLGPDAINAHYASGYGSLAPALRGIPLVLNVWGSDVYEFPDKSPLHRALLRRNLLRADAVVSTSRVMAERTMRTCPALREVAVVPFGVDTDRFSPAPEPDGPLTIGTVKALAPKYGIDTLIEAFALLARREEWRSLRLRIAGDGPERARLEALARGTGFAERIEMVGAVPHGRVPDELRRLHVYAALSRADSESFGVAVIEASACGKPVVVSRAGGLPEVVDEGATGLVVPKDDPAAAARALERLLRDGALRAAMGAAGRARVMQQYEWRRCVDLQLDAIRRAMEKAKR